MMSGPNLNVRGARRSVRPWLESLEGRDCPAAPVITAFSVAQDLGNSVNVGGWVTDENPQTAIVQIAGAANGYLSPDAGGYFSGTLSMAALGQVTATATDDESLSSNTMNATPANLAPSFINFQAELCEGPGNAWIFYGQVSDEYAPGLTVYLNGLSALNNVALTVDENGYFNYTAWLQEGEIGTASANVTDWWGVAAQTAYAFVR